MTAKKHVEMILQDNIEDFTQHKTKRNLQKAFEDDKRFSTDYHGRELFELLQNVDDAYEELCQKNSKERGKDVTTLIEYKNNILRVCNTGTKFTKDTVERLCQGAVSSKDDEKYIGNKGIGFRSVLNWTKKIRLYSGEYSIEFSEDYADVQLEKIKDNEIIKAQLLENPDLRFPILAAPKWIDKINIKYDTAIELFLSDQATDRADKWNINNQINEFDFRILLFLPNITEIVFSLDDKTYSFSKTTDFVSNIVSIQKTDEEYSSILVERYFCYTITNKKITKPDGKESTIKMSIAIPVDAESDVEAPLYTYFPIGNTKSPFNAILNATFLLSSNRDSINKDPENECIFKELLKFYIEKVTETFCKPEYKNRNLELLCPKEFKDSYFSFDSPFNSSEIRDFYFALCKDKAKFYTVNGTFINQADIPKLIEGVFPKFLKGEHFTNLLIPIENSISKFVKHLIKNPYYSEEDLCNRISNLSESLTIPERVESFVWWIDNTKNKKFVPKLLLDNSSNQNWIEAGELCFFSGAITEIPSWASFKFLNKEYEIELIKSCSERNKVDSKDSKNEINSQKRSTIKFLSDSGFIRFREYSVENLVRPLNECVDNNFERSVEFVRFLYKNIEKITETKNINEINFHFPNADGTVSDARSLYIGSEYGNVFPEKILKLAGYTKLCPPNILGLQEKENDAYKDFFSYFGVVEYPRIEDELEICSYKWKNDHFNQCGDEGYRQYVLKNKGYYEITEIKGKSIREIDVLFRNLKMGEIIEWISLHDELKTAIESSNDEFFLMYRGNCHSRYPTSYSHLRIPCYLNYFFSITKWLEINGEKVSPCKCLLSSEIFLGKFLPCLTTDWINQNRGNFSVKEFKDLLFKLGVKDHVTDLESNDFYSLLIGLQEDDSTASISKQIYKELIENGDYSVDYRFLSIGKVWTKENGYQPVSEVYFSSSDVINIENKYLIDIPLGRGSKDVFEKKLGVKPFVESYKIVNESINLSNRDSIFQEELKEYLPYVLAFRRSIRNKTLEEDEKRIERLEIHLVCYIEVSNGTRSISINKNYTVLRKEGILSQWYIYIGDEIREYDKNELSENIKWILSIVMNSSGKEFLEKMSSLFVSDKRRKLFLLEQEYGENSSILKECKLFLSGTKSEKELVREDLKNRNKFTEDTERLLDKLEFNSFDSIEGQKKLCYFCCCAGIDIDEFNEILNRYDISIKDYNFKETEKVFTVNEEKFKHSLYTSLKNKDVNLKKTFLRKIDEYNMYPQNKIDDIDNSIFFDPNNILKAAFSDIISDEVFEPEFFDVEKKFQRNKRAFKEKFCNSHEIEYFFENQEIKSLLYFDYQDVESEFIEWNKQNEETNGKQPNVVPNTVIHSAIVEMTQACRPESKRHIVSMPKDYVSITPKKRALNELKTQEQGRNAEIFVYNAITTQISEIHLELEKKLGIKFSDYEVGQISESLGNELDRNGRDDLGYDIELKNRTNGERIFIEVKSSVGYECRFIISKNELDFAKLHSENYIVIFVGNITQEKASIQVLPKKFWSNTNVYEITPERFVVRCVGNAKMEEI